MNRKSLSCIVLSCISLLAVFLWPESALADTPDTPGGEIDTNIIHELAKIVLSALGVALATLVTVYVPRLARAIEKRLNIDIPDPLELEGIRVATDAIAFAEEWGRKEAKKAGDKVLSGGKLNVAAAYFREHASAAVTQWLNGQVEEWIEAKLGRLRLSQSQIVAATVPDAVEDAPTGPLDPSKPGAR